MVPVRTARDELDGKTVIAVNVNSRERGPERYDSLLTIALQVSTLWATRNAREEEMLADVVLHVSASGIPLYDLRRERDLLRRERAAAETGIADIRCRCGSGSSGGHDRLEEWTASGSSPKMKHVRPERKERACVNSV